MCGIFGFVGKPSIDALKEIAEVTHTRGPHAFGFAWITQDNRLRSYKQQGRIIDYMHLLELVVDAKACIGHCRYTTHGTEESNINNHPHPCDGGWLVHNGMVQNYRKLNHFYGFAPSSECDSETLAMLIETHQGDTYQKRAKAAVEDTRGVLAIAGLWSRPNQLVLGRRGNPLSVSKHKGTMYFASYSRGMPGRAAEFPDNKIQMYDIESMSQVKTTAAVRPAAKNAPCVPCANTGAGIFRPY